MNRRDAVLTIPTAIAAVALKLKANPTPTGAREVFLNSAGDERSIAGGHYLKLLKAFSARVFGHEPRIPDQ